MRDLRATTSSLRDISDRLNQQGIGGVMGGQRLPDYERRREENKMRFKPIFVVAGLLALSGCFGGASVPTSC